jgi:hypothetical protein
MSDIGMGNIWCGESAGGRCGPRTDSESPPEARSVVGFLISGSTHWGRAEGSYAALATARDTALYGASHSWSTGRDFAQGDKTWKCVRKGDQQAGQPGAFVLADVVALNLDVRQRPGVCG